MTTTEASRSAARTQFTLPVGREAAEPPEERGLARDEVRLLVARAGAAITHGQFVDIVDHLAPGDLVVVNTSATLPAAMDGLGAGGPVVVHFSTPLEGGDWVVELRRPDRSGPVLDASPGSCIALPAGAALHLLAAHPQPTAAGAGDGIRLWRARVAVEGPVEAFLARHGRPIAYSYVDNRWPLSSYQTIFAGEPGSAEMPSAGRPFSHRVVTELTRAGVSLASVVLHTGVSSLEAHEPPQPERYRVSEAAADSVNRTRAAGGRVVAVGTTVTRALETVADADGTVRADGGWTDLVLGPDRPARTVTGLVTGGTRRRPPTSRCSKRSRAPTSCSRRTTRQWPATISGTSSATARS